MTQRTFASSALMFSGKQHYPVYVSNDSYYLLKQREVDRITKTKGTKERFTVIYNDVNSGIPLGVTVEHQQLPITIHLFLDRNQSTLYRQYGYDIRRFLPHRTHYPHDRYQLSCSDPA